MRKVKWEDLQPLPKVSPWNRGRRSRTWEERRDDYADMSKEAIVITAELVTPVLQAERDITHLDSILSWAALTNHPVASHFESPPVIPLPIELAWVSPEGKPLWACTPLMPTLDAAESREYWHKRYPNHRSELGNRLNANTTSGRWREYRVPVHATTVKRLHALAIGNVTEVESLLSIVSHVGKKGAMGYGRVANWTVTRSSHSIEDVLALRPVPASYFEGRHPVGMLEIRRAWTPPYWYSPLWADCLVPERQEIAS